MDALQIMLIIFYATGVIPAFILGYNYNDKAILMGIFISLTSWVGVMLYIAEDNRPGGGY